MFTKVLIANRGAIATRILRTLKSLNITSVAVYAHSDIDSLHVRQADIAVDLGEGGSRETYLNIDQLIRIAHEHGCDAIIPGYGFLSENPDFVARCDVEGLVFVGPTAEQISAFGLKHEARELALAANVPLLPGSGLLATLEQAKNAASRIGYPVMLKSTAGGGGIGMQLCEDEHALRHAFDSVKRLSANNFSNDALFVEKYIERARHIEVQVFGDGDGDALAIGERDCSAQRRHQKVLEECPAPNLDEATRQTLHKTAETLLASVDYRNVGTVEFIVDAETEAFYFLEVNARLQVEHGVTELVYGIDLVEWMLQLAAGESVDIDTRRRNLQAHGHAVQVRLYAEDPYRQFQPSSDILTRVRFPEHDGIRVDTWVDSGCEVSPWFDPMLAKMMSHADSRDSALQALSEALAQTELYGCETNMPYLKSLLEDTLVTRGLITTRYLETVEFKPARIDVERAGTQTMVQDVPGRTGYWHVGVPPSGAFDGRSFRLANALLGNPPDAAGLEITFEGPRLRFSCDTTLCLTGANIAATLDGVHVPQWQLLHVSQGQTLDIGRVSGIGARAFLCIKDGIQCPGYLGSRSTFTLGKFGGHNGRALRTGDVLHLSEPSKQIKPTSTRNNTSRVSEASAIKLPLALLPKLDNHCELRVIYGPHGAPDFFTQEDIDTLFQTHWEVHYNSSRTGVRLIGPEPHWARTDGGEAGLHPSNIHDNAYAFGSIDFTGDMPVILGPDGPSLGGFVCPATVIQADLWKLGQLRAGDTVRFISVSHAMAVKLQAAAILEVETLQPHPVETQACAPQSPIVSELHDEDVGETVTYRAAGDQFLLVEYGEQVLDIRLRFRAHALMQWLMQHALPGIQELTPGIRSLQVHYDSQLLSRQQLLDHLVNAEHALKSQLATLSVPSRIVHLPLSWDDEACREAIEKYTQSVRPGAPWCPSNLDFIRRINGLDSIDDVKQIVFEAAYLVMGLGDVYLGAPVATPVDPCHRLVTTKYNPARTWTAENSVGIGGSYLCVYGMEGPGGYQFVGRTLQMWNRFRKTPEFEQPWLLQFFDQIRFFEVSHDELMHIRERFPTGRYPLKIEQTEFSLAEYESLVDNRSQQIAEFQQQRSDAFATELAHWHATGQFRYEPPEASAEVADTQWSDGSITIDSPVSGSLWESRVNVGDTVASGDALVILESMKMELTVTAHHAGVVTHIIPGPGDRVSAGQVIVVLSPDESAVANTQPKEQTCTTT